MKLRTRTYSGSTSSEVTARETINRQLSRKAAAEGVVLLKNEGVLPVASDVPIAIYGNGIAQIIKGGTGSGDVNSRNVVSMLDGLKDAGYTIVNETSARKYMEDYERAGKEWGAEVLKRIDSLSAGSTMEFFGVLSKTPKEEVKEIAVVPEDVKQAKAVVYIISRIAGEGRDRFTKAGDYYLTKTEEEQIAEIRKYNQNIILIINTGAQIDLTAMQKDTAVKGILYLSQPGCEAGNVIADVLSGKVNPSGKLTSTWSEKYEDFPNAGTFSHCNGDTANEKYEEGIFVGYRYFDSFGVETLYPFGYGLSYTTFETGDLGVAADGNLVTVTATITNTGNTHAGRHVVEVYAACPKDARNRELKKLIGFKKTALLKPGESETVTVTVNAKEFAAFDENQSAWVVDAGEYAVFVSENANNNKLAGVLSVPKECVIEKVTHISPIQTELLELEAPKTVSDAFENAWKIEAEEFVRVVYQPTEEKKEHHKKSPYAEKAREIAEKMSDEELTAMLMGEITKGQDNIKENELVETGIFVPGAAGETSCRFVEKYGIPAISMADGPAGLRLMKKYDVDNESGLIYGFSLLSAIGGDVLTKEYKRENVTTYYQYATAIPIGTLLAQTWDPELMGEVGRMIGQEMLEFGVAWWLAPGMNIHRNPLCGRNFEYYSEDPFIAGTITAAMTKGVQSIPGVGTTIKHYAANNQEDNRMFSNSIMSERTLREIYLRGFEIAVKESQPMCVMTSYNQINGVPAANNKDLITTVLRGEWDFQGIVMTDWTTTTYGSASPHKCAEAGNDLIMPGNQIDIDDMMQALSDGTLNREDAIDCAARLITALFHTIGMEG